MNRLWQQLAIATNWPILVASGVLSALGVISMWVYSPANGSKQLGLLALAPASLGAVQEVHYMVLGRWAWGLYIVSLLLVAYTVVSLHVTVPGVHMIKGASCWITFPGGFQLEPSELMKVSFVMVLARYLRFRSNYRTLAGLLGPFALMLVPVMLILIQPDFGVASLFVPTLFAMLFVAGAKAKHLVAVVALTLSVVPVIWLSGQQDVPFFKHFPAVLSGNRRNRVVALLSPNDPRTKMAAGYQQDRALVAAGSGGWVGKGIGDIPVGHGVPEAHDDMIFALIGEQFGFIGSLAVIAAYIVLFAAGVEIAAATKEPFGRLVAVGIVSFLAAQAFLNLMVVLRLFPVTGVTLPFVSYGGSSLMASYIAAGLLLNIGQNRPLVIARDAFDFD